MIGTALGMANDDVCGSCILQHFSGNVAGMRPTVRRVAILAAGLHRRARQNLRRPGQQRCGHADQRVGFCGQAAEEAWPIERSSGSDSAVPFIFQLPATKGRIPGVIVVSSRAYSNRPSLPKSSHKAIDTLRQGRYCASFIGLTLSRTLPCLNN